MSSCQKYRYVTHCSTVLIGLILKLNSIAELWRNFFLRGGVQFNNSPGRQRKFLLRWSFCYYDTLNKVDNNNNILLYLIIDNIYNRFWGCTSMPRPVLRCPALYFSVLLCTSLYFSVLLCISLYFGEFTCRPNPERQGVKSILTASASRVLASASRVLTSASRVWPRRSRGRGDNNSNYDRPLLSYLIVVFTINYVDCIDFRYFIIGWRL